MSQSYQPCEGTFLALDEQKVCSAQDVASEHSNSKGEETPLGFPEKQLGLEEVKRQETIAPRLSREPLRVDKYEVPRELLDGCYLIASVLPDLTHSCQPYRRTLYSFEEKQVSLALVDKNLNDRKKMEDQQLLCPRLNRRLLQVEEHEVPQESWDEADSTLPIPPDLTDSYQSDMRSALHSLEEQQACVALDVDKINKDQEELADQDPPCRRLRQELLEVEEQEVPENSLDEVYLTPLVPHDLCDCHQAYSGTLYSLEDQLACSALDIACEYSSLKVTKLHRSPRQPLSVLLRATCAAEAVHLCRQALYTEPVLNLALGSSFKHRHPLGGTSSSVPTGSSVTWHLLTRAGCAYPNRPEKGMVRDHCKILTTVAYLE
uniref:Olduvai domain-containing protein n=1 Tax=Macaca mulatta TaxID=9544 RepID=F7F9R2_MACMU